MKWETVIGLEVHAELSTETKLFCGCKNSFSGAPNTNVCPICAGMPGALPKLNSNVVEYAIKVGHTLNCTINQQCRFDRKNYFYPDLPKAYQISQLHIPICQDGHMVIMPSTHKKTIGIREIHIEEDAGKLIHDAQNDYTLMDYNRCGVPLLEIVTYPDFRGSQEVLAYLEQLREILMFLDVCDGKMQEGSLRVDINLSVRPQDGELGVRTEMKNLNSFKAIGRAIEYESARQIKVIANGGEVTQETRRWDDDAGISHSLRLKEDAQDYRYFPEPDLLPLEINAQWLADVVSGIPKLAHERRRQYIDDYGLAEYDAAVLTSHSRVSDLFELVCSLSGEPIESARLIIGEIMRLMNQTNTLPDDLTIDAKKLAILVIYVIEGKINRNTFKEAIEAVFTLDVEPEAYITEKGLMMLDDYGIIAEAARSVVADNSSAASDYVEGIDKAFGFLMGQVMRKLGGTGNPELVRKALEESLQSNPK